MIAPKILYIFRSTREFKLLITFARLLLLCLPFPKNSLKCRSYKLEFKIINKFI